MQQSCCVNEKICSIHSVKSIDDLLYRVKEKMQELSNMKLRNLHYGYGCASCIDGDIDKLSTLKSSLNRIKSSLVMAGSSCLSDKSIQLIVEKTQKIVGKKPCPSKRKDVSIDDSQLKKYLMSSPACVSFDTWNEFANTICGELGIKVTAVNDVESDRRKCDITFEISREIISCDLLYALSVRKEMCDLGYSVNRTDEECKIDWKLLIEKNPNCDLDFKTYSKYVKRDKLTYPIIDKIYASGLTLAEENGAAVICTPLNRYGVTELTPTSIETLLDQGFIIQINRETITSDFK